MGAMQIRVKRADVRVGDILLDAYAEIGPVSKRWPDFVGPNVKVVALGPSNSYLVTQKPDQPQDENFRSSAYEEFLVEREVPSTEPKVAVTEASCVRRGRPAVSKDELTPEQCYQKYCDNMSGRSDRAKRYWTLTPEQKRMAQEFWSAQLRTKVAEQKAKDDAKKVSVIVDYDDE